MSLHLYLEKSEIPEGMRYIDSNDEYFNAKGVIPNTDFARMVLKDIDKAERLSDNTFLGRDTALGAMYSNYLSTGTKTVLNVLSNPQHCFNASECGRNAASILISLPDGNIYWSSPMFRIRGSGKCDVICRGRHYDSFYTLQDDLIDGEL